MLFKYPTSIGRRVAFSLRTASAALGCLCLALSAQPQTPDQPPVLRLPGNVAPESYQVQLKLDPDQTGFTGKIAIKLDVKQPVQTIWLNATGIEVSRATLSNRGKTAEIKATPSGDEFLGLTPASPLTAGPAEVEIEYRGKLRLQDSSGVFRMVEDGNKYIYTQFEDTDARAAFPCFDEPSYKVPWQLTLEVPQDLDAISNTPVAKEEQRGGDKVLQFKQTKPLPSYLVAFAVGHFDFVSAGFAGKNRAPVRIVTPKGHGNEAKYAAQVTATILTRLENYFDIPFPYEKSDQVAIPTTYGFGAMENAGMVTYAQDIILANPRRDTVTRQREYASVAAHELAHQWFGDLVTTAWWNDIWLNEAFATWMEQKLVAEWKPEWETRVEDVDSKLGAESEDTLTSARKIRQEIKTKDDISNAFDAITYQKGAAVIGMFENWVGDAAFRKGVHSYLEKYAFRNASAPEFLAAISSSIGHDVQQPFSTFLNQAGVPLISMSLNCQHGSPVLHLEQQRSLPINTKGVMGQTWQIPVCIRYGSGNNGQNACELMTDPRTDWTLKGNGCPAWVEANDNALGYYRVAYQGNLVSSLTEGDVEQRLSAPERVDLIGNAQALSTTGKLPDGDVLALVPKFHADPNRYVVERAIAVARGPNEHLVPDDLRPNYQRFVLKTFQSRAHELGWLPKPNESENDALLRPDLLQFVSTLGGDRELAKQASDLTANWFTDHSAVPANETAAVLETAAYYGDRALFQQFLAQFKKTTDQQERRRILAAMISFRDPAALQEGMAAVLNGQVSFIEGARLLFAGQHFPETRKLAFDFMKEHIDELAKIRPTGGGRDSGSEFVRVGASFCDQQSEEQLKQFFEPQVSKFVGAPRMLAQTTEQINSCIANKSEQESSVANFLRGY
ncbi:MAG TPA: M1 family metallopeptidase [Bryobacteraceae bacterium]|nr:M1 family metallopeptidase [Bryobacteraceae bacterium]